MRIRTPIDSNKRITANSWPKSRVKSIECRKRDLIIRIADWTRDKEEPAFDVEIYKAGVYDWNESKTCTTKSSGISKSMARRQAILHACYELEKLL